MSSLRVQLAAQVRTVSREADPVSGTGQALPLRSMSLPFHTPGAEHPHQPEEVRKLAVDMYTEGSSLEAIGRVLGVKPGTVYSWVKKSPVGLGVDESPGGAAGGTPPAAASPGHIL